MLGAFPPDHDRQVELRDHLDPASWASAVARILDRHGLSARGLHPFPSGSDVVWGTDEHVVKLTAPTWTDEIASEARILELVAGRLPVASPTLVAHGTLRQWPYVVMTRLPGRALSDVWPALDARTKLTLSAQLGGVVAALHAIPVDPDPGWDTFVEQNRAAAAQRQAGTPYEDAVDAFLDRTERPDEPPVLLHTELLGEHLLFDADGLCGVIDFADGRVGHPLYEVAAFVEFLSQGEPELLSAFFAGWGRPQPGPDELLAWDLLHRFGQLSRLTAVEAPPTLEALARRFFV
jgi:hygromycin-B 7''-O-kinase